MPANTPNPIGQSPANTTTFKASYAPLIATASKNSHSQRRDKLAASATQCQISAKPKGARISQK